MKEMRLIVAAAFLVCCSRVHFPAKPIEDTETYPSEHPAIPDNNPETERVHIADSDTEADTGTGTDTDTGTGTDTGVDTDTGTFPDMDGSGDSCADHITLLKGQVYSEADSDFTLNYTTTDVNWSSGVCPWSHIQTPEIIFAVPMVSGDRLFFQENESAFSEIFRVLDGCNAGANCHHMTSAGMDHLFIAPQNGLYYAFVQYDGSRTPTFAYDLTIGHYSQFETNCTDGLDDDADSLTDCADPDCTCGGCGCDITVFIDESFDTDLPLDWMIEDGPPGAPDTSKWQWNDESAEVPAITFSGPGYAHIFDMYDVNMSEEILRTPLLTPTEIYTQVTLAFSHRIDERTISANGEDAFFEVLISTDLEPGTVIASYDGDLDVREALDITSFVNGLSTFRISFRFRDDPKPESSGFWSIDDLVLTGY